MKLTITWGSFQSRLKPSTWRPLNHKITVLYLHGCPRVSQSRVKYKSRIWLNGHNLEAMTRWSRRCTISSILFPSVAILFFCNHLLIRYTKSLGWCTTAEMPFCGALTAPIVKYLCGVTSMRRHRTLIGTEVTQIAFYSRWPSSSWQRFLFASLRRWVTRKLKWSFVHWLACRKGAFRKCFPFQPFYDNLHTCSDIGNEC